MPARRAVLSAGLAALVLALVVLLTYADSISLPFHFDDVPHYVWLRDQSLGSIWVTAEGRPYYRPMQFFFWKVYEVLFGRDSVPLYHGLNVFVHFVNALLVAQAMRVFTRAPRGEGWTPALLAGLIFTLYPFSYQVVPLPASFTHPLVVLFALLTLLAYDRFRTRGGLRWFASALACALLAFASNEGGLVLAGLVALYEWLFAPRPVRWRWIVVLALLSAAYFGWYQTRPRQDTDGLLIRSGETLLQNGMYALQALTLPAQPAGRALMDAGLSDHASVLITGAAALALLWVISRQARRTRHWLFAVAWVAGSVALPVLLLSHDYLINAPRVLYLAACGVAWLWAGAVSGPWRSRPAQMIMGAVSIGVVLPSFVFIRQRMDLYHLNAGPLQAAIDVATLSGSDERLLFVNLPAWVNVPRPWYPIGHEGVLFMPAYATMAQFLTVNTGRPSYADALEFNNVTTPQAYYYGVYGPPIGYDDLARAIRSADRVYLATYTPHAIDLIEAGRLLDSASVARGGVAAFGGSVTLERAAWSICANRLSVALDWRGAGSAPGDLHVFVHLLNPDGTLAAQHDSPPIMGLLPFWQWHAGDRVRDVHPIDLPSGSTGQPFTVAVGLYDSGTGQRAQAALMDGTRPPNDAVPIATFTLSAVTPDCDQP